MRGPVMTNAVHRRSLLLLAAAALARPALAREQQLAPDAFTDLMPAFWAGYDAHRGEDPAARVRSLVDGFFRDHADTYRRAGMKRLSPLEIEHWLARFDEIADGVRTVHRRFAQDHAANLARFRAALPDVDGRASPITLLPSVMHFDAHLEPDGQSLPLFFGPDGIVRYHGADADIAVLFAHELFHCYQGQKNPAMSLDPAAPVFAALWMEGTATYASERLVPGASPLRVLLDDHALAEADDATLRRAARALAARLDATDEASQAMFFETNQRGLEWPSRMGYALGLRIARSAGATMTLPAMAALPAPRVREVVERGLREFG